jgi:tripartite-type tricarboxylate transporter receptor subunit TctC
MKGSLIRIFVCLQSAIGMFACGGAQADAPPVSIVVPQPVGNPTDGVARKLQPLLQAALGRTVIVENQPGAGGSIGTQRVLNAPADGRMMLIASQTEPILTPATMPHVKYRPEDLRAVAVVARLPYILTGRASLPAGNLDELTRLARDQGDRGLNFGHIGPGSMIHLLGEQWARQSEFKLNHVVYRGVPPVTQDLMGAQIDLSFLPLGGSTLDLIESGRVRAYATTAAAPGSKLPQVPPLSSAGGKLQDFVYGTWIAFFVPAKTPDATVASLNRAIVGAMEDAAFREYVVATGMEPVAQNTVADMRDFYGTETSLYLGLAKAIGVEQ